MPPLETPVHSQACLGQSLVVSRLLSLGPGAHNILFVVSKGLFPVLCKFWWLYGGLVVACAELRILTNFFEYKSQKGTRILFLEEANSGKQDRLHSAVEYQNLLSWALIVPLPLIGL